MTDLDHRVLERRPRRHDLDWKPMARDTGRDIGRRRSGRRLLGIGALLVLLGSLAVGVWQHYTLHLQVAAAAEQQRDFVPSVRVATVQASPGTMSVTLPATTNPFETANIFARASGYIAERNVDIGSQVKEGDLLATITLPSSTTRSPRPKRIWRKPRRRADKPRRPATLRVSPGRATLFSSRRAG